MSIICPRCGKNSNEKEFIEAFCIDCYPIDVKMPKKIVFEVCKKCGKIKHGKKWVDRDEEEVAGDITRKCKGDFFNAAYNKEEGIVTFFIKKREKILKINKMINVNYMINMCTDCSRMSGGYFESIIQLRGNPEKINSFAKKLEREIAKITFVSKVEEKKEGIDLYIGSTHAVLDLIKEIGHRYTISKKLAGVNKEGKRQYRTTFAIRLE